MGEHNSVSVPTLDRGLTLLKFAEHSKRQLRLTGLIKDTWVVYLFVSLCSFSKPTSYAVEQPGELSEKISEITDAVAVKTSGRC